MRQLHVTTMADPQHLDLITERVERLLLRHEELLRTNQLLHEQVKALQAERDSLRSRLNAARARIDALLDRLPQPAPHLGAFPDDSRETRE
jgi:cell division septum initiation protein DivIVA